MERLEGSRDQDSPLVRVALCEVVPCMSAVWTPETRKFPGEPWGSPSGHHPSLSMGEHRRARPLLPTLSLLPDHTCLSRLG